MKPEENSGLVGVSRVAFLTILLFFLAPAVIVYSAFSIFPLLSTILYSTYDVKADGSLDHVGLENFRTLLGDPTWSVPFWNAFRNNVVFFLIHMLVQNPIGVALAALLSLPRLKLRSTYRTLIFMPTMLSVVIIGFVVAAHPVATVGHRQKLPERHRIGLPLCTMAGAGGDGAHHPVAHLRLAVRRHSDDPHLHGTAGHPG